MIVIHGSTSIEFLCIRFLIASKLFLIGYKTNDSQQSLDKFYKIAFLKNFKNSYPRRGSLL